MVRMQEADVVRIICDLRRLNVNIDSDTKMKSLWRSIEHLLVGKKLTQGKTIEIPLGRGQPVVFWIVEARGLAEVTASTVFHIVDILRNPALLYRCRVCKSYGPLRCVECVNRGCSEGDERLCSKCAYSIDGRWSVYCSDHIPRCRCHSLCGDKATFFCEECKKLNGSHFRHEEGEYCKRCYDRLFGQCSVCKEEGKSGSLGQLRCEFKSQDMAYPCGEPLCWEHGLQWKIWGPHSRGITFCERHKRLVRNTDPKDVLTMMITTHPPRQKRSFSLANAFRLRRLLNFERSEQLSFEQIGQILHLLSVEVSAWDRYAQKRYLDIRKSFDTTLHEEIPHLQEELLKQVKEFYATRVSRGAANAIRSLIILDRFIEPGKPRRYSINVYLSASSKGPYIGHGGEISKQLQAQLNISGLDFWDATEYDQGRIE